MTKQVAPWNPSPHIMTLHILLGNGQSWAYRPGQQVFNRRADFTFHSCRQTIFLDNHSTRHCTADRLASCSLRDNVQQTDSRLAHSSRVTVILRDSIRQTDSRLAHGFCATVTLRDSVRQTDSRLALYETMYSRQTHVLLTDFVRQSLYETVYSRQTHVLLMSLVRQSFYETVYGIQTHDLLSTRQYTADRLTSCSWLSCDLTAAFNDFLANSVNEHPVNFTSTNRVSEHPVN